MPRDTDGQDDLINAQLETFLGLLPQLNATCDTEAVSGSQTLSNVCKRMYDQLFGLTKATQTYVSNYKQ